MKLCRKDAYTCSTKIVTISICTSFLLGYLQATKPFVLRCCWVLATPRHFVRCNVWSSILGLVYLEPSRSYALGQCHASSGAGGLEMIEVRCRFIEKWRFCKLLQLLLKTRFHFPVPCNHVRHTGVDIVAGNKQQKRCRNGVRQTSGEEDVWLRGLLVEQVASKPPHERLGYFVCSRYLQFEGQLVLESVDAKRWPTWDHWHVIGMWQISQTSWSIVSWKKIKWWHH